MDELDPYRSLIKIDKKIFFLNFGYLIRVEHKKCSEMCVRIVLFGLILIKWSHF
jgi:hypothetical protein